MRRSRLSPVSARRSNMRVDCEVCDEALNDDWTCPNDNDPYHDEIQFALWAEQGVRPSDPA